jgi:tetratricopeptide (TPR) repeat protein
MDQGHAALQKQDSESARHAFELALAMEPDNAAAEHGLQRAKNLDRVILLQRQGLQLEKQERLSEARSILLQATQLDPEFIPAAEILARVENKLNQKRFQQAMSTFFAALEKGKLSEASRSLQQAASFHPSHPVLQDAEKQLQAAEIAVRLTALEKEYKQWAAAEQWQQALEVCQQALRINPQAGFAVQAGETVKRRLALDQALVSVLARPERLQDDAPLAEAGQILETARLIKDPGPRLAAQIASLDQLLTTAATKVEVILRSDEATEVIVYRVKRLGTFAQKRLKLRPGTYTIVGTRPGFRDVRHKIEVKAGQSISLFIRCEEAI